MDALICCKYSASLVRPDAQNLYNVRFEVAEDSYLGCYIESNVPRRMNLQHSHCKNPKYRKLLRRTLKDLFHEDRSLNHVEENS